MLNELVAAGLRLVFEMRLSKIDEYKKKIDSLRSFDKMEVYSWLISLGKKLADDPLSEEKRIKENQVSYCQYQLYVDWEDGCFKAWSDALIASGYAYLLLDIFNSVNLEEASQITKNDFKQLEIQNLLSMNRTNGFYQMIEMIQERIKNETN